MQLTLAFVTGGAELTLTVDKTAVYDRYFLPGVPPFPANLTFDGAATIAGTHVQGIGGPAPRNPTPIRIRAIDTVPVRLNHSGDTAWADFPRDADRIGRVVCTLTLAKTPKGVDPWDRVGSVYVLDEKGERFEVLRFITPYRRAYQWSQDVTDLLPLLTGKRRLEIDCTTYGVGWLASVDFTFYPDRQGQGDTPSKSSICGMRPRSSGRRDKPVAPSIPPIVDAHPRRCRLRRRPPSRHGSRRGRTRCRRRVRLTLAQIDPLAARPTRTPCGKTTTTSTPAARKAERGKFDRAGWGPGTVVDPWVVDVTPNVHPGCRRDVRL